MTDEERWADYRRRRDAADTGSEMEGAISAAAIKRFRRLAVGFVAGALATVLSVWIGESIAGEVPGRLIYALQHLPFLLAGALVGSIWRTGALWMTAGAAVGWFAAAMVMVGIGIGCEQGERGCAAAAIRVAVLAPTAWAPFLAGALAGGVMARSSESGSPG